MHIQPNSLDLSVIIPFKDHADLTIPCLESLQQYAPNIKEILLISNNSSAAELNLVKKAAQKFENTKVLIYDFPFNFQKINNWAVRQSTGKVLFLLNNDVELFEDTKNLLAIMYSTALKPYVGAVGCTLVYEDKKTIQHAGIYLIPGGTADHLYIGKKLIEVTKLIRSKQYKYDTRKDLKVTAVTAAAVMISRVKFNKLKGMNEAFLICGGDVDLCLRLNARGYQSLLVGSDKGIMIHKESRTRSTINIPYVDFLESYKSYINHFNTKVGDPYLHWKEIPHA